MLKARILPYVTTILLTLQLFEQPMRGCLEEVAWMEVASLHSHSFEILSELYNECLSFF